MRVLLTGATGFIGSHVARELIVRGHDVTALVRSDSNRRRIADCADLIRFLQGDLEKGDLPDLPGFALDCCIHAAWYCEAGDYRDSPRNAAWVSSSMKLIERLAVRGIKRIVVAGSCFEYALGRGLLAESCPIEPFNTYAAAKHGLHVMAEQFCRRAGMSLAWARIFYLYGPAEGEKRLVPYVIRKLLANAPCPLTRGDQVRDFLHVSDVAHALCDIAQSETGGSFNIGSQEPVTVADVAREIGRQLGRPDLIQLGAQPAIPGDPPFICADSSRLRSDTGWRPQLDLRSGIAETIDWWRNEDTGS